MTLNAVSDAVVNYADPGDFITNAVASQVDGVGGSGGDYQMQTSFEYPLSLETGYFISRFISNYASGTDTKTGIETEFGLGGWPIQDSVLDLGGTGSVGVASAANLSAGTDYVGLHFWISTAYYTRIFVDGTHTLSDAINDTVGDGGTTVYPTGDAVIATNSLTISGTVTAATDITGTFTATAGAGAGTLLGTASADRQNGTFSEGTPALSWVDVAANGQLTVTSGQTVPAAGSYSIQLTYDNTSAGGGTYSETMTITVNEAGGSTDKFIPIPVTNANQTFASVSALKTAVDAFASNFATARTTYGVPSGEPVLQLDAGSHGDIHWSNVSLSERITIRGTGPYSHDGYAPTAGTKTGTLRMTNCTNMRFMGMECEPSSIASTEGSGTYGSSNHRIDNNCDNISFVRCAINGDVARSTADLGTFPPQGVMALILARNSDNCEITQCSLIGAREVCIGLKASGNSASAAANDWTVKGNVMAQVGADGLVKLGGRTMLRWQLIDNLGMGKGRASGAAHRDFVQITATSTQLAVATNWVCTGNCIIGFDAWANDKYLAKQGFYWGAGVNNTNSAADINNNFFGLAGRYIWGRHTGANVRFNTGFVPLDSLGADSSDSKGTRANTFTANIPGPASNGQGPASFDENIFPRFGSSQHPWTGPNGAAMFSTTFAQYGHTGGITFDWSNMGAFMDTYDDTVTNPIVVDYDNSDTSANNGKYQVQPREGSSGKGVSPDLGLGQWKPKTGTRAHWDHADPTGCFQLFKWMYDETDHDHWKDWGWPTAPAAHIYYDPTNDLGGASGSYTSFDANGA